MTSDIPIHIVTQLWGTSYVNLYANYVIPSLLTPNNLPALKIFPDIVYEIYTTQKDKLALENNSKFVAAVTDLKNFITFKFIQIDDNIENPYATMSMCHRQAINVAEARRAAILFLQPDVIVTDGSLLTVKNQLLAGKRLVLSPGLRVIRSSMEKYLDSSSSPRSTRDLVSFVIANLHPISKGLFCEEENIHSYCSHLYWRVGLSAIYARCAHMHPLMVYPKKINCGFQHTIDWDYFYRACPKYNEWYVARNSDEIALLELSDYSKFAGNETWRPTSSQTLADFLAFATRPPHIKLLTQTYFFLGRTLQKKDWAKQHENANQLIDGALKLHRSTINQLKILKLRLKLNLYHSLIALKTSELVKKNVIVNKIFFIFYTPLRFIWRLQIISRLKNETNVMGELLRKFTGDYNGSYIINKVRQLKHNFLVAKNSGRLNKSYNVWIYFTLYYFLRFIWRRKLLKKGVKEIIIAVEFIPKKLIAILRFSTAKFESLRDSRLVMAGGVCYFLYHAIYSIFKLLRFRKI